MKNSIKIASLLIAANATAALADPILINAPNPLGFTLTKQPDMSLEAVSPGFDGAATYQADFGIASFGASDFLTNPPAADGSYAANGAQPFSYQASNDSDQLTATIFWQKIQPGGEFVFVGSGPILSSSGDAEFMGDFASGTINITANFPFSASNPCDLEITPLTQCLMANTLVLNFEGGSASDAGGGTTPHDVPGVPEPSTLGLLMAALLGLAGWRYALRTIT